MSNDWKQAALHLANTEAMSWRDIAKAIEKPRSTVSDYLRTAITTSKGPRIGVIDIEQVLPLLGYGVGGKRISSLDR